MECGIYKGLTFTEYRAIPAINKSALDYLHRSPAHLYYNCISPTRPREPASTPAMRLGTAIHARVLEPEKFTRNYVCMPEGRKRPTVAQVDAKKPSAATVELLEFWDEFDEINAGREVLTAADWVICERIAENVRHNPVAQELFATGDAEVTLVWLDPVENVKCKARVDWLATGVPLDLKSTASAVAKVFGRRAADLNWHIQAAFYSAGIKELTGEDHSFIFGAF